MDSKAQQDNNNMQIQSPGTKTGRHHGEAIRKMEQWEIRVWSDTEKIDRVHRANAQRHTTGQSSSQKTQHKHSSAKTTTCVYYNKDVCTQKQTHETKGVLYKHVCVSCWSNDGKAYPHPMTECTKNAKRRLNLDMTLVSSHVHKARTVINSNYSNKDMLSLSGWSKNEIRHRFESSIAFTKHRDVRTYAQVVADKSDSGYNVVHNNAGVQYRKPVVDFCALTHKVVDTNLSSSKVKDNTVS